MTTPSDQPVTGEALVRLALTLPPGRVRWYILCAAAKLEFSNDISVPLDPAPIKAASDALSAAFLRDDRIPAGDCIPTGAVADLRDAAMWAALYFGRAEAGETA